MPFSFAPALASADDRQIGGHPAFSSRISLLFRMRLSRSSILLAAAVLAALSALPDLSQREEALSDAPDSPRRAPHPGEMNPDEIAAWIQKQIQASANARWSLPRKEDLATVCAKLSASDRMALLEEIEQWHRGPTFGQSNKLRLRLLRLQPLRNLLLEQVVQEDLETALRHFPSGAEVLLKATARKNGSETLKVWNEFRDEWRGLNRYFPPLDSEWIEGVGEVPLIADEDQESAASAALAEGWAASDPETAWAEFTAGQMKDAPFRTILNGFFRGLSKDSNWSAWTHRLESLPWKESDDVHAHGPRAFAAVALTRRWIESNPDEAMAWFIEDKAAWDPDVWVSFPSDVSSFKAGTSGRVRYVSEHVFLLAEWMKAEPEAASSWLSRASEALAPKDVLREAASEMDIPESLKTQIAARCGS